MLKAIKSVFNKKTKLEQQIEQCKLLDKYLNKALKGVK